MVDLVGHTPEASSDLLKLSICVERVSLVDHRPFTPPPSQSSGQTSPTSINIPEVDTFPGSSSPKKKKKRRPKKSAKAKEAAQEDAPKAQEGVRPPPLCISRNKHWKYISSYHGPWLQLPLELLDTLLVLNMDPTLLLPTEQRTTAHALSPALSGRSRLRDQRFESFCDHASASATPRDMFVPLTPVIPTPKPGTAAPPPIDPGALRTIASIRRLVDEAAGLAVRATSAHAGGAPNGCTPGEHAGGAGSRMSAMRMHKLRVQAVQKLARGYAMDEVASSVVIMQGGTVFDDLAQRVLKVDPNDVDAKYVHFFHEKIPSRQVAESTTTQVLDSLIAAQPQRLEFYRTRGIVHCFRDEYPQAARDFTHALKEARCARRAKGSHDPVVLPARRRGGPPVNGADHPSRVLHPSVLPDAPDPLELQLVFLRGASYLQHALFLIEDAVLKLEEVTREPPPECLELRLSCLQGGRYGGVEVGHPDGPLGARDGEKLRAYRRVLAEPAFREQVYVLVRKSMRDHEKFLSHFDTLESPDAAAAWNADAAQRLERAFSLSESMRPGASRTCPHAQTCPAAPPAPSPAPAPTSALPALAPRPRAFTTYHPLRVEAHYGVLLGHLLLGDFRALLPAFVRVGELVDALEGYPVFLPPRAAAQAEFVEVCTRLVGGWRNGLRPPRSLFFNARRAAVAGKLALEATPSTVEGSLSSGNEQDPHAPSTSAAGASAGQAAANAAAAVTKDSADLAESLDCLRMLLAPVAAQQLLRAEQVAEKASGGSVGRETPLQINVALHGPRVDVVLAWLAAVHLVELDSIA